MFTAVVSTVINPKIFPCQAPPTNSVALDDIRDDIRQLRELLQAQQQEQNVKISDVLREEVAMLEGAVSSRLGNILAEHNAEQGESGLRIKRMHSTSFPGHLFFKGLGFEFQYGPVNCNKTWNAN